MSKILLLAQPRGFCAGVYRAIATVERALALFGSPIYVRHEIVHNSYVVDGLRKKGAIFIEELNEVPEGSTLIFSAHGVSKAVQKEAEERGLQIFDATCPLVTKVHVEVSKMHNENHEIIMIGHHGHPEVEGTMGQVHTGMLLIENTKDVAQLRVKNPNLLGYVSQTTLSVDDTTGVIAALKKRFPFIAEPKKADICYATTNRQTAVKALASQATLVIVVGSPNSSNSNRLWEVAEKMGAVAHMVDNASQIDPRWLERHTTIGLTAGASAPEILVQEVVMRLKEHGVTMVRELEGIEENLVFPLPKKLSRE